MTEDCAARDYDALLRRFVRRARKGQTKFCRFWRTCCAVGPAAQEAELEVAEHYQLFGGVSPLNSERWALIAELRNKSSIAYGPRFCQSIGAIAIGIRCCLTRWLR